MRVGRGERVGLLGANGAGKSTAMGPSSVCTPWRPAASSSMAHRLCVSTSQTVARGIALVPEGRRLFPA